MLVVPSLLLATFTVIRYDGGVTTVDMPTVPREEAGPTADTIAGMTLPFPTERFLENRGQVTSEGVLYYTTGPRLSVGFCAGYVQYHVQGPDQGIVVFRTSFEGDAHVQPVAEGPLAGTTNFLKGSSEASWRTGVASYEVITYHDVMPGIDVSYHFKDGVMKYDVIVGTGSSASSFRMRYEGIRGLGVDSVSGDLLVSTDSGVLRECAPISYQTVGGSRMAVGSKYVLIGDDTIGFSVGPHSDDMPLIIDPGLAYSTYLGGDDGDVCSAVDVDGEGNVYAVGFTQSTGFPMGDVGYDLTYNGAESDGFVLKLSPDGATLLWSTFIGGDGHEGCYGVTVDMDGSTYVVGSTASSNFPTTPGVFSRTSDYRSNGFILKLNASGTKLDYSTLIGGWEQDICYFIQVDSSGNAYVSGTTRSNDFPTTSGAFDRSFNDVSWRTDVFLLKMNPTATALVFSTFLGGTSDDVLEDMHVDGSGMIYLLGRTASDPFPTTVGAYARDYLGWWDIYVTKFKSDGTGLVFSTLVGTVGEEHGYDMFVEDNGSVWVIGSTSNETFPATPDAMDQTYNGNGDTVLFRLAVDGSSIEYSTFLGGSYYDVGYSIVIDEQGSLILYGSTSSDDFPVTDGAFATSRTGRDEDLYITKLECNATSIIYSTYIGGSWIEHPYMACLAPGGFLVACGFSLSNDLPRSPNALDRTNEYRDGFLMILDIEEPELLGEVHDSVATTGDLFNISVSARDNHAIESAYVEYWTHGQGHRLEYGFLTSGEEANGTWYVPLQAPDNTLDDLEFIVHAWDWMGNRVSTGTLAVHILDNDPPSFENATHENATTGDPFNLSVTLIDNIGIENVHLMYWSGDRSDEALMARMLPMDVGPLGNGTYNVTVAAPTDSTEMMHFLFVANDTSGNSGRSVEYTLTVRDNDGPVLRSIEMAPNATTGDQYEVVVDIADNVAIDHALVVYWFGSSGREVTRPMQPREVDGRRNGLYAILIPVPPDSLEELFLRITMEDPTGNLYFGQILSRPVVDDDPPTITPQWTTPWTLLTGGRVQVLVDVRDNIGVEAVDLLYGFDGAEATRARMDVLNVDGKGSGVYVLFVDVPLDATAFEPWFEALDTQGNHAASEPGRFPVTDDRPPTVGVEREPDGPPVKGLVFELPINATDNVALFVVDVSYRFGDGEPTSLGFRDFVDQPEASFITSIPIPRDASGLLRVVLSARDRSDNRAVADEVSWDVVNAVPQLLEIPLWTVVEGSEGTLDLSPYVLDANDPLGNLTVTCDDGSIRVSGMNISVNLSAWSLDRTLRLMVSDGEDTTNGTLVLRIVNVNDPPVITALLPENGTEYRKGKAIAFTVNATDEDGDEFTVTWKEGDSVLGTGAVLEYSKLGKGEHTITVVVDDGTTTVEDSVVVVVKEDKKSPGVSAVVVAASMVLAALVAASRKRQWGPAPTAPTGLTRRHRTKK